MAVVEPLSVTELFKVGIGPSSSHTVGPMRAAAHFASLLAGEGVQPGGLDLTVRLLGSLGATGRGHATDRAVLLGLSGHDPETVGIEVVETIMAEIAGTGRLLIPGVGPVPFDPARDLRFEPATRLPHHANALVIATSAVTRTYYSVGGGFVEMQVGDAPDVVVPLETGPPLASSLHPYTTAAELVGACDATGLGVADLVRVNEHHRLGPERLEEHLDLVANTMLDCVDAGLVAEGELPGGLRVRRRAKELARRLGQRARQEPTEGAGVKHWAATPVDPMRAMDWVNLYSLAVNEENAAGHRVVTAPTNGAAGVIPGVIGFLVSYCPEAGVPFGSFTPVNEEGLTPFRFTPGEVEPAARQRRRAVHDFLLAATAVGSLIKNNASIAGAEVGCQGEVGSAAAMAAAGLAQALGGSPRQVENAAEIAMEHSLGLTCDPVGGLVQVPCIERNAMAAIKAINAARMAMWGDGEHRVSLDAAIETMRQTGADMLSKYKETSSGGLAVNVVEC
ncbi:L-serine ammonia-lyase, iron-sulfur-dependent, subunit alpha [Arachnia propionica]|uniref:L-serine ammonia-lyase n=1 Tax=Arachnia propionica TaxID=1750 RepID=A0A3P1WWM1_9ACTN|nr:L-serine ammonia-lyase, iron-sulfur-dependent, subunit alpha [Arachnia propionica]RRD50436.1 L-serine ammonia-lyase [Arachnia propionica]